MINIGIILFVEYIKRVIIRKGYGWLALFLTFSQLAASMVGEASLELTISIMCVMILTSLIILLTLSILKVISNGDKSRFIKRVILIMPEVVNDNKFYNIVLYPLIVVLLFSVPIYSAQNDLNSKVFPQFYYLIERQKDNPMSIEHKVVLGTYKDYYITAPLNCDNKTFKPEFELVPMTDKSLVLKYMKIGPLSPGEPKTGCKKR
jgi:hypothetical protein